MRLFLLVLILLLFTTVVQASTIDTIAVSEDVTFYKDAKKSELYMTSFSGKTGKPNDTFLVAGVFGC